MTLTSAWQRDEWMRQVQEAFPGWQKPSDEECQKWQTPTYGFIEQIKKEMPEQFKYWTDKAQRPGFPTQEEAQKWTEECLDKHMAEKGLLLSQRN